MITRTITAAFASLMLANSAQAGTPPNILFLNADDLGWADAGFMGSGYYETPHLDRLAASGMVLTHAYAPAANCAPSRASVYTGQVTPRHGVLTVGRPDRGAAAHRRLVPPSNKEILDPGIPVFPRLLKDAGYQTVHVGKFHVGEDPLDYGFEVNIGGSKAGHPRSGYFSPYGNPALPDGPEGEYLTERLAAEVVDWLAGMEVNRPFFLSMQFYSPHTPIEAMPEMVVRFEGKEGTPLHDNAVYAAMVAHLDEAVGRILAALEARGLLDNTFVVFTSDNGGLHDISRQDPLRGEKGSYYEGGIRVPMIASWPGRIAAGSRSETPVSGLDFFPTFLEVADVPPPLDHLLDGESLLPMLAGVDGGPSPARALFWHFPVYLQAYGRGNATTRDVLFRTRPGSVVRQGPWKLHEYFEDGALELYHLGHDPGERQNLAHTFPEQAAEMHAALVAWREKTGATVPTEANPAFDADAEREAIRARIARPGR